MQKITKILVPVDFSEGSRAAVAEAHALAKVFGATVELLYVWPLPPLIPSDLPLVRHDESTTTFGAEAQREAEESLAAFVRSLAPGEGAVVTKVIQGDPVSVICDYVNGFDLVVMGTHGRTGLSRLLLGSVSEGVVRRSRVPVLTVHPTAAPAVKEV